MFYRDEKGAFQKAPKNKFYDGEIVRTTPDHYSPNDFVRVIKPAYVKERGWGYGKSFINLQGRSGGGSFSTNEDEFLKLTRVDDILMAEKIYLKESIDQLKMELKQKEKNLEKVNFSLNLSLPEHNTVTHSCKKCFTYFTGFKDGDPNKKLCKKCLPK